MAAKETGCLRLLGRRKEWDGRCSNSFTDNDEAIDMAAGDTTPKLIRHTLYTHISSSKLNFLYFQKAFGSFQLLKMSHFYFASEAS